MDVRIINNSIAKKYQTINKNLVLLTVDDTNQIGTFKGKKYYIYNINKNEKYEILEEYRKYEILTVVDCMYESKYLYFTICKTIENSKQSIEIVRYDYVNNVSEVIYGFNDDIVLYDSDKKTKIFILDENYLIIQHEYLIENRAGNYHGYFDFELSFYSIENKESYIINEENFTNNGIENIYALAPNICAIKIGYDLFVDHRYNLLDADECSAETIALINVKQLISELLLKKQKVYMNVIDNCNHDKTFPYFKKIDDYLVYSKYNYIEKVEEVYFYNYMTKERIKCSNKETYRSNDLLTPLIAFNKPYVLRVTEENYEFVGIEKNKVQFKLPKTYKIRNICNGIIITEVVKKSFITGKNKNYIEVFQNFNQDPIIKEAANYVSSIANSKDSLYIFTK